MATARSRNSGVLFAEQQTQRIVGADRLVSLRQGRLVVESTSDVDQVTISLQGPASQLGELTDAAAALGFRYLVERE